MYFDAHNHLQDDRLRPFAGAILAGLAAHGIERVVVNGSCESDWSAVMALAREHPCIIPSLGYHPWYVAEATEQWEQTLCGLLDEMPLGIGEIGLDRWIENPDLERQERIFRAQLQIASERNLPASIHCLKAWGWLLEVLRSSPLPASGFLLHSYGGPQELVSPLVKLGAYFSFPGAFLATTKARKHEAFRAVPAERLLIETDAPDQCLPKEFERYPLIAAEGTERLNHPWNLEAVYEGAAAILNLPLSELMAQTSANAARLFGKLYRPLSAE